ncbi:hypothetical protein V8C86DRAFT_2570953 [Haematococcus lacustris]
MQGKGQGQSSTGGELSLQVEQSFQQGLARAVEAGEVWQLRQLMTLLQLLLVSHYQPSQEFMHAVADVALMELSMGSPPPAHSTTLLACLVQWGWQPEGLWLEAFCRSTASQLHLLTSFHGGEGEQGSEGAASGQGLQGQAGREGATGLHSLLVAFQRLDWAPPGAYMQELLKALSLTTRQLSHRQLSEVVAALWRLAPVLKAREAQDAAEVAEDQAQGVWVSPEQAALPSALPSPEVVDLLAMEVLMRLGRARLALTLAPAPAYSAPPGTAPAATHDNGAWDGPPVADKEEQQLLESCQATLQLLTQFVGGSWGAPLHPPSDLRSERVVEVVGEPVS